MSGEEMRLKEGRVKTINREGKGLCYGEDGRG